MPVARKLWQPILVLMSARRARRRTMRQTSAGRVAGQRRIGPRRGAEEGAFGVGGDAGGFDVFVEPGFEGMVGGHDVLLLDIGGDGHRLDRGEMAVALPFAPCQESDGVAEVGAAGMGVLDMGGEILSEAGGGVGPGGPDDVRRLDRGEGGEDFRRVRDRRQLVAGR